MISGFKTGANTWEEGQEIVLKEKARMCELWFRIDALEEYPFINMLEWLRDHGVSVGLHYWGVIDGKYKPNMATHHDEIREASIAQVKETLDIAGDYGCLYVNVHPGAGHIEKMDLDARRQSNADFEVTSSDQKRKILLASMMELSQYAVDKKTVLTVETLPALESTTMEVGNTTYDAQSAELDDMRNLAEGGVLMANDISHTMATVIPVEDQNTEEEMWRVLNVFLKDTAMQTRLIHVNTLSRPYNGTDSHNGLQDKDFTAGVFPSRGQMKDILRYFKDLDEVYLVPEPKDEMRNNYQALVKMIGEVKSE